MTSSRYLIARVIQTFGYFRKNQRMANAASEMHLLREAEAQLGSSIWQNVEAIDELSVEYWNLRKFIKERKTVLEKITACQARIDHAHEERAGVLNTTPEVHQELLDQRATLLAELEKIAQRRDEIIAEASEVRRSYNGLKMKLEVLTNETSGSDADQQRLDEVKSRLVEHKARFAELKQQRIQVAAELAAGDARTDHVDLQINDKIKDRRLNASEAFQVIGEANKEMSALRAESSLLDTQMRQLYAEIGRFVSRHTNQYPACATAAASHQGLVHVMRALRRSIVLNHRLAGTA